MIYEHTIKRAFCPSNIVDETENYVSLNCESVTGSLAYPSRAKRYWFYML